MFAHHSPAVKTLTTQDSLSQKSTKIFHYSPHYKTTALKNCFEAGITQNTDVISKLNESKIVQCRRESKVFNSLFGFC